MRFLLENFISRASSVTPDQYFNDLAKMFDGTT